MAPSSFKKIGAAVACATAVRAATESYQLSEEYTADNFFDKFDFFTSTYTSGDSWDSTHGYVQYRGQADAESLGLISTSSSGIYIGPDTNSTYDPDGKGRDSVRITSKAMYNEGLMIAKFSHMPVQACGAWPAFWSFGSPWLTMGEIDYFEGWNMMEYNRMAMHTNETLAGECALSTTGIEGTVMTSDCNNEADGTGCGVKDDSGVWSSTTGATFAMEWTDSAIKVWSWLPSAVPSDITAGTPDPSSSAWGNPTLLVEQTNCDLSKSFANQQLVFNIDFCGDTAGSPTFWNETCSAQTGATCASYVANNPSAFAETYFMIEGIQYYELGVAATSAAASVSVTASASLALSTSSTTAAAGLLSAAGSVLESTLGVTPTSTLNVAVTAAAEAYSHTTSYIYGTSTSTDEFGFETTVVVVVDTTICPVTAAEASTSSLLASGSSVAVAAETTPASTLAVATATSSPAASHTPLTTITRYSTSTSRRVSTSTILVTTLSTITSCAPTATTSCTVGDVTQVVSVSTTICPVTASASRQASSGVVIPSSAGLSTSDNSPVQETASSSGPSLSTVYSTPKTTVTAAAAASSKAGSTSIGKTTEVISATETGGGLEVATGTPTSISLEWMTQATAAASVASYSGGNGTVTSSSASATQTDDCSGLDCIVVSSSGSRTGVVGVSGLALAAFAGAFFMF